MANDIYQGAGYGTGTIGFGSRPGIVVVDFQKAFSLEKFPLGKSPHVHRAIDNTTKLLSVARRASIPIANVYTAYSSPEDAPRWKVDNVANAFFHGREETELDPRIYDPDYDAVFLKSAPSALFQTAVVPYFIHQGVDTVIITGCTTSGCVRATVNDAFSFGYRVIVPEPCSGDMDEGPHQDNLRDVGRRYCDVLDLPPVLEYLERVGAPAQAAE